MWAALEAAVCVWMTGAAKLRTKEVKRVVREAKAPEKETQKATRN